MADQKGRFVWYELMASDTEAAKAFYTKVVGWGTQDGPVPGMAYTMFTTGADAGRRNDGAAGGRPENGSAAELDRVCRGR